MTKLFRFSEGAFFYAARKLNKDCDKELFERISCPFSITQYIAEEGKHLTRREPQQDEEFVVYSVTLKMITELGENGIFDGVKSIRELEEKLKDYFECHPEKIEETFDEAGMKENYIFLNVCMETEQVPWKSMLDKSVWDTLQKELEKFNPSHRLFILPRLYPDGESRLGMHRCFAESKKFFETGSISKPDTNGSKMYSVKKESEFVIVIDCGDIGSPYVSFNIPEISLNLPRAALEKAVNSVGIKEFKIKQAFLAYGYSSEHPIKCRIC